MANDRLTCAGEPFEVVHTSELHLASRAEDASTTAGMDEARRLIAQYAFRADDTGRLPVVDVERVEQIAAAAVAAALRGAIEKRIGSHGPAHHAAENIRKRAEDAREEAVRLDERERLSARVYENGWCPTCGRAADQAAGVAGPEPLRMIPGHDRDYASKPANPDNEKLTQEMARAMSAGVAGDNLRSLARHHAPVDGGLVVTLADAEAELARVVAERDDANARAEKWHSAWLKMDDKRLEVVAQGEALAALLARLRPIIGYGELHREVEAALAGFREGRDA